MMEIKEGEKSKIQFNQGVIYNITLQDINLMHNGSDPNVNPADVLGWGLSELVMFPIIGPAPHILINGVKYAHEQHGLSRSMPWKLNLQKDNKATFVQNYNAGTDVRNIKFKPGKTVNEFLTFPQSFAIYKNATIEDEKAIIDFVIKNTGEGILQYQKGWHPAFRRDTNVKGDFFVVNNRIIEYEEVLSSKKAIKISNVRQIAYLSRTNEFYMHTGGYGNIMLWSPHPAMFCIEPVSRLIQPENNVVTRRNFHRLKEGEKAEYKIEIGLGDNYKR